MKKMTIFCTLILLSHLLFGQFQLCNSATDQTLYDVWFIDAEIGVAVGDSGTIVRSTDGGSNWEAVLHNDTVVFKKVKFFDGLHGLAIGSDLYRTQDGGLSWTPIPHPNNQFYDLAILNETTCILTGQPNAVVKSTDLGLTFTTLVAENTQSDYGLLSFVNDSIGYTCTYSGGDSRRTLKTIDGGATWSIIEALTTPLNPTVMTALSFVSEDVGFKGGWYNAHLQKTTDGSQQWSYASFADSLAYHQLLDFHITSTQPDAYYSCGWYGEIFKSTDGGNQWSVLYSGVSNTTSLYGIYFLDDTTGWVVGQYGTILKTTNGGTVTKVNNLDLLEPFISIYPNPTRAIVHVLPSDHTIVKAITLVNLSGKWLKSVKNQDFIDLVQLPSGVYSLYIETSTGSHFEKIVKH